MNDNRKKIGWCDKTINPVVGCTHGCPYCYARKQAKRQKQNCEDCYNFVPHQHLERLKQITPRQKPMKIFIDSMWDWCCEDNKVWWLDRIIDKMEECSQHIFQILSKNPSLYNRWQFPVNAWLGTSVTGMVDQHRVQEMHDAMSPATAFGINYTFVSVEPLLYKIDVEVLHEVDWIIIGALSRTGKKPKQPKKEWVEEIIEFANVEGIPVFTKDNLTVVEPIKEFPKQMEHTIRKVA